jgi:hypothetical protein
VVASAVGVRGAGIPGEHLPSKFDPVGGYIPRLGVVKVNDRGHPVVRPSEDVVEVEVAVRQAWFDDRETRSTRCIA